MALDPSNETFKTTFETVKKSLKNKQILQEEMNETLRKASAHETQSKAPLKISEAKDNLVLTPSGRSPTQINEPALRTFYESAIKHMSQRNLDEAIRLLTDIYKEDRRYQDVSKKLVICLRGRIIQNYANREYEKAEADLDKVLKIDPSNQRLAEIREMNEAMLTKIYALQSKKNP
jgi:tetratricopeptide (TPR) repeat protein